MKIRHVKNNAFHCEEYETVLVIFRYVLCARKFSSIVLTYSSCMTKIKKENLATLIKLHESKWQRCKSYKYSRKIIIIR